MINCLEVLYTEETDTDAVSVSVNGVLTLSKTATGTLPGALPVIDLLAEALGLSRVDYCESDGERRAVYARTITVD